MAKSLKSNYIFNLINTVSQILFPLITFPYATRIMLPNGIGQVNFFTSIIGYITLFTSLGIPIYAIKATAAVRNDRDKLNITTVEIVSLNLILTILGYVAVGVICMTVPKVAVDIPLFLILSLSIFFTTIGCDWFYRGIEDFKYITIRGIVVKLLSMVLLFCFVKTKEDILIYGLYTVIGSIGGNIFNFVRLRKYISVKAAFQSIHPFRHLKPILHVFLFSAITSFYLQLNTIILGFMKDSADVGFYTTALKIFGLVNGVIASLATVMLPRISNLVAENDKQEIMRLAQKAYDFSFVLSLPIIIGLIVCSPYVIHLLCGENFMPSASCIQIMAPIMLFLSISSLLGYQILYPMGQLNLVICYCIIGCIINIVFDLLLISKYSYVGVSIAYMSTEMIVAIIAMIVSRKFIKVRFFTKTERNALVGSVLMGGVLYFIHKYISLSNDIIMLLTNFVIGAIVFLLSMFLLKDPIIKECVRILHK